MGARYRLRLIPGEKFHANVIGAPNPDMVEMSVKDVFAMGGAFHEGAVDIFRGIDAFCQILGCVHSKSCVTGRYTQSDQIPDRVFARLRVFVVKVMVGRHSFSAHKGLRGKASVPSEQGIFSPGQFEEPVCSFILGGERYCQFALRINWERSGLLSKTGPIRGQKRGDQQ